MLAIILLKGSVRRFLIRHMFVVFINGTCGLVIHDMLIMDGVLLLLIKLMSTKGLNTILLLSRFLCMRDLHYHLRRQHAAVPSLVCP